MPFTDHCDIYAAIYEAGLNTIVRKMMSYRPALFNYGTPMFAANPHLLCTPVNISEEALRLGEPIITLQPLFPIIGADGAAGLEYCLQITKFAIDFHSSNQFALPPELLPLSPQQLALNLQICCGIACPERKAQEVYGEATGRKSVMALENRYIIRASMPDVPAVPQPLQAFTVASTRSAMSGGLTATSSGIMPDQMLELTGRGRIAPSAIASMIGTPQCFCLDVYAKARIEIAGTGNNRYLAIRLEGVEIADIQPAGLENSLECYLASVLRVGLLPHFRLALDTMVLQIPSFASLSITPVPVQFNPAIEQDQLKIFINVGV